LDGFILERLFDEGLYSLITLLLLLTLSLFFFHDLHKHRDAGR
jgi:hypothetical protein